MVTYGFVILRGVGLDMGKDGSIEILTVSRHFRLLLYLFVY